MRIPSYLIPTVMPLVISAAANAQPTSAPPAEAQTPATTATPPVEDLTQTVQTSPQVAEPTPVNTKQATPNQNPAPPPQPFAAQPIQAAPLAEAPVLEPSRADSIHRGFYMRIGSGLGLFSLAGDGPRGNASITGLGGLHTIALGGSIARGVVLGGTLTSSQATAKFHGGLYEGRSIALDDRTVNASPKADASFNQLGVLVDWFPDPTGGWHLGGSIGFGTISVLYRADDNTDNAMFGTSASGSLFGGYDWSLGKAWALGISITASGVKSATLKYMDDGKSASGYKLRGGTIGVQGTLLYF